ncbi:MULTISPECIES: RNA-binding domain-containing protein [unclassified Endozoicomonas]|uniref:RNA-binding domain-containing protein n=1 Tax=unclassified Endozoicomonas TaxID=2644528 RepID=UPI0021479648|nr:MULTISPECIES: RNA-binding domain-containing protein [unclassified Endozoicomonas]
MLKSELLEIIANGENSGVEFKRDDIRPEQLAVEVVAMANLKGGMLLMGVEDDGSISGIERDKHEEWVMNAIADKVHPMLLPYYEEVQLDSDHRIAVISFTEGVSKPYVLRHKGREDVFIRVGSTSRRASREQQARLFACGGVLHTEALPVAGSSYNSLDQERLSDYLKNVLSEPDIPQNKSSWINRLVGLGFMTEGVSSPVCTVAGMVLFGISPRRYLRQSGIRVIAFDGEDKTYQSKIDKRLDFPLVGLWKEDEAGERSLSEIHYGLIEKLIDLIEPYIGEESGEIDSHFRRERRWYYPKAAVRELVINALAHRDWTRSVDIEIGIYNDRLELISSGTLQNSMTVEKMLAGQRSPRNPIIVEVLRDYGYVEARGMGVRTKIVPLLKQHNGNKPCFELTEDYLKTTFYKGKQPAAES